MSRSGDPIGRLVAQKAPYDLSFMCHTNADVVHGGPDGDNLFSLLFVGVDMPTDDFLADSQDQR